MKQYPSHSPTGLVAYDQYGQYGHLTWHYLAEAPASYYGPNGPMPRPCADCDRCPCCGRRHSEIPPQQPRIYC